MLINPRAGIFIILLFIAPCVSASILHLSWNSQHNTGDVQVNIIREFLSKKSETVARFAVSGHEANIDLKNTYECSVILSYKSSELELQVVPGIDYQLELYIDSVSLKFQNIEPKEYQFVSKVYPRLDSFNRVYFDSNARRYKTGAVTAYRALKSKILYSSNGIKKHQLDYLLFYLQFKDFEVSITGLKKEERKKAILEQVNWINEQEIDFTGLTCSEYLNLVFGQFLNMKYGLFVKKYSKETYPAVVFETSAFSNPEVADYFKLYKIHLLNRLNDPLTGKMLIDSIIHSTASIKVKYIGQQAFGNVSSTNAGNAETTEPAADFFLQNIKGGFATLSQYKGKYVILDFWATWCKPCVAGMGKLKEIHTRARGNLELISLSVDEDINTVRHFLSSKEYPWVFLHLGTQSLLREKYKVQAFPTYVLVDQEGRICFRASGLQELKRYLEEKQIL